MDTITCCSCRARIAWSDARVFEESQMQPRAGGRSPLPVDSKATYCRDCAQREHPECSPDVVCAGCRKVAHPDDHAGEKWIRIDPDGRILYPVGNGARWAGSMPPPPNGAAEAVCDVLCLAALRERRTGSGTTGPQ